MSDASKSQFRRMHNRNEIVTQYARIHHHTQTFTFRTCCFTNTHTRICMPRMHATQQIQCIIMQRTRDSICMYISPYTDFHMSHTMIFHKHTYTRLPRMLATLQKYIRLCKCSLTVSHRVRMYTQAQYREATARSEIETYIISKQWYRGTSNE